MTDATLNAHLQTGATHVCSCWAVTRRDGVTFGFTDHDTALAFDNIAFTPDSGLSAKAITSTTGLSVNNTEALGVLSADAITDADIEAGRFDGAEVKTWLVRWDDVADREVKFTGSIGEIVREAGTYRAELRGQTEMLNQPQGRAYLKTCSAVLGDASCKVGTSDPAFRAETLIDDVTGDQVFRFVLAASYTDRWFEGGIMKVRSGTANGLEAAIKSDETDGDDRVITLWRPLPASIVQGDAVWLIAGCDKRSETCRVKFDNLVNFQGFPDIPGDDWLMSVPRFDGDSDGGSMSR
ncbi:MAG: DUF2163 domain-containing protein [Yoonia sp.]|nr:DUF2163 domain-containing protein [Yoonia sp.]